VLDNLSIINHDDSTGYVNHSLYGVVTCFR